MAGEKSLTSTPIPWITKLFLTVATGVTDASRRHNGTVNRRLLSFLDIRSSANPNPQKGVKTSDFTVDSSRNLWIRVFYPTSSVDSSAGLPVVVFFHGGGFAFLSADSKAYDDVCRRLSRRLSAVFVSVNYRLSPENRFPAQYDDGFDVIRWLDDRPREFSDFAPGADVGRLFLMGDSAGGNLSHHVAQRVSATPSADFRNVRIIGLVAVQPFFGGEERTPAEIRLVRAPIVSTDRTDWHWKVFLPDGSDRDHEAANVFGPNRKAEISERFPGTLVFVGGFDPLQDWQRRYYEGLKQIGREAYLVEYRNAIHAFYIFPQLPECQLLISETLDFMKRQCDKVENERKRGPDCQ